MSDSLIHHLGSICGMEALYYFTLSKQVMICAYWATAKLDVSLSEYKNMVSEEKNESSADLSQEMNMLKIYNDVRDYSQFFNIWGHYFLNKLGIDPKLLHGDSINSDTIMEMIQERYEKNDDDKVLQDRNFDVSDHESYFDISMNCVCTGLGYSRLHETTLPTYENDFRTLPIDEHDFGMAIVSGRNASEYAFKYIGYWQAKMEEKRRNIRNVSKRTKIKIENLKIVNDLLKKRDYQIDRDLITKAMRATDRGERTVKDMIKEIYTKHN